MRIGFDTSPLVRPHPSGIVRVVAGAIDALEHVAGITALRLQPEPHENLLAWRQFRLPQLVRERELSGLHSFLSAFALLGRGKRVQTLHELPWLHGVSENSDLAHRFWASVGSSRADLVFCGTQFVAREAGVGRLAKRVRVTPWGVDAAHFGRAPTELARRRLRVELGLDDEPFAGVLFAPGAVRRKKNLVALLAGLCERKRRGAPPLLAAVSGARGADARRDQAIARSLGVESQVRWLGDLGEEQYVALLHEAQAIAVLSHSEGFSLPVLEAFAAGRSVLVARGSAQSEVASGLGVEVDPADPAAVADGIEAVLQDRARDAERRAHAATRTWARCAARIAEAWRELA